MNMSKNLKPAISRPMAMIATRPRRHIFERAKVTMQPGADFRREGHQSQGEGNQGGGEEEEGNPPAHSSRDDGRWRWR